MEASEAWTVRDLQPKTVKTLPTRTITPSLLKKILARRELSALVAAVAIFIFFWVVAEPFRSPASMATVLYQSATIGLMAVSVAMLMIGGEFDLSSGVAVVSASAVTSIFAVEVGLNLSSAWRSLCWRLC